MKTKNVTTEQKKLPKWFANMGGVLYNEGAKVTNRFSGESIELDNVELSLYDYIKGCEMLSDWDGVQKGLSWFMRNNAKAYLILLD